MIARRLPSRDQANEPMGRFRRKPRELTRSAAAERLHPQIPVARVRDAAAVWRPCDGRVELRGPIARGEVQPGRSQTTSDERPSGACAVKAIDPPSGETATLAPSVSFVGVPPSIGTIQIDTVPPAIEL